MSKKFEVLRQGEAMLEAAGITDWKTDAWLLFEYVTEISRAAFLMESRSGMEEEAEQRYRACLERRCLHEPLQHITGRQEFMALEFEVNKHVLVPRMDTEVLVLELEKHLQDGQAVLDMCTGSGCIAISLKKRNETLNVTAVDVSKEALKMAKRNAQRLQADIRLYESDLFEIFKQLEKFEQFQQFDRIVSNPPYIPSRIVDMLEPEVREHEPRLALDGALDGLEYYRKITKDSKKFLTREGMLFYEIGHDQGQAVRCIMEEEGFRNVTVVQDLAGLDRVVYGGLQNV